MGSHGAMRVAWGGCGVRGGREGEEGPPAWCAVSYRPLSPRQAAQHGESFKMPPPVVTKLKLSSAHSSSLLSGQTNLYSVGIPRGSGTDALITVRLRRKGGDPLLMVRCGPEPPSVPRRSKIVADAWDQEAFDAERLEHSVTLPVPTDCSVVHVGVVNYSAHRRETTYYTVTTSLQTRAPPAALQSMLTGSHSALSTTSRRSGNCGNGGGGGPAPATAASTTTVASGGRASGAPATTATPRRKSIPEDVDTILRSRGTPGAASSSVSYAASWPATTESGAPRRVSLGAAGLEAAGDGAVSDACRATLESSCATSCEDRAALRRSYGQPSQPLPSGAVPASRIPRAASAATPATGGVTARMPRGNAGDLAGGGGDGGREVRVGRGGLHPPRPLFSDGGEATIVSSSSMYLTTKNARAVRTGGCSNGNLTESASASAAHGPDTPGTTGGRIPPPVKRHPPTRQEEQEGGAQDGAQGGQGARCVVSASYQGGGLLSASYHEETRKLEFKLAQSHARRTTALDAADSLAALGCRQRLLSQIFSRWLRACSLRAAREGAYRGFCEAHLLACELEVVEAMGHQHGALAEAAELHTASLQEQLAFIHREGEGERQTAESLRAQLEEATYEVASLRKQLAQAKAEQQAAAAAPLLATSGGGSASGGRSTAGGGAGAVAAMNVVSRELDDLDNLSERISEHLRARRAAAAADAHAASGSTSSPSEDAAPSVSSHLRIEEPLPEELPPRLSPSALHRQRLSRAHAFHLASSPLSPPTPAERFGLGLGHGPGFSGAARDESYVDGKFDHTPVTLF